MLGARPPPAPVFHKAPLWALRFRQQRKDSFKDQQGKRKDISRKLTGFSVDENLCIWDPSVLSQLRPNRHETSESALPCLHRQGEVMQGRQWGPQHIPSAGRGDLTTTAADRPNLNLATKHGILLLRSLRPPFPDRKWPYQTHRFVAERL